MGYTRHHAILVTSFGEIDIKKAHSYAETLFDVEMVSAIASSPVNFYWSFVVFPDGSKEYWPDSDRFDELRKKFVEYLKDKYLYFAHVQYGDESGDNLLLEGN